MSWMRSHRASIRGGSSVPTAPLLLWLWIVLEVRGVSTLSGCQRCDQTGDCTQAYNGGPGQFCGHWLDRANQRQSCCCPLDAVCRVSNYACNCHKTSGRTRADDAAVDPLLWLWWLLGALALATCCGCCVYMMVVSYKRNRHDDDGDGVSPVPMAYPVGTPAPGTPATVYGPAGGPNYGTAPPLYTTPAYAAPAYGGGGGYGSGGSHMGAGTGAALGGTAGLLGGFLLGEALADAGDHGFSRGGVVGDAGAGGGGFDAGVGDFGGDF